MKIKNLLLSIIGLLLISINSISAQDKCKYDMDKKDPMTGKQIRNITTTVVGMTNNMLGNIVVWMLGLEKAGDDYYIGMTISLKEHFDDILEKGDSLMIKLANDDLVTLYSRERIIPNKSQEVSSNFTSYDRIAYNISADDLKKLATSNITFLRMNTGSRLYQKEVGEKISNKIMKGAACIMK